MEKPNFYRTQLIMFRVTKYFGKDYDPKVMTDNLRYPVCIRLTSRQGGKHIQERFIASRTSLETKSEQKRILSRDKNNWK